MESPKIGPSFFGKENYEKYLSELTTEGTIGAEKLTPGERVEGFKKRNDKIGFESFVNKVLERKKPEEKEKISEGNISRVNIEYDNKVPTGGIKTYGAITTTNKIPTIERSGTKSIKSDSKLMSLETLKPIIEEQAISLVKDENGTFRSEIDPIIEEVSSEVDPITKELSADELENLDELLKEVREDDLSIQPIPDDQKEVLDNLIKANKSLLSTNELIEGFTKSIEKEKLKEEKRRFKEEDAKRKKVRKESFLKKRSSSLIGRSSKSISKSSGIFEGLLKFGFLSALAGLVPLIPKLIEFIESIPNRIETFFKETIPEFIDEKFSELKDTVEGFFDEKFKEVKESFGNIYDDFDEFTGGRLTEFIDGVKGLGPLIVEKSQEFYKTIDDWTGGKISGAFNWIGINVLDPMTNFFSEKFTWLGTEAGKLWSNFSKTFLSFMPDLGITESLGLTPKIEGPDLTRELLAIGGSTAAIIAPISGARGMAVEGMDAGQVANQIPNIDVSGKSIQLGTGLSQGGSGDDVRNQINSLREGDAKGIQVLGTDDEEKDTILKQIVSENNDIATFLPAVKSGTGGIDYRSTATAGSQQIQQNAAMREEQQARQQGGVSGAVGTRDQMALLDSVSFAEGTSKSYGTIFGGKVVPELERGQLTIDQVHAMMMSGKLNGKNVGYATGGRFESVATGRYQFMPDTLRDIQRNMKLPGDTLFTPEMQDKMILDRLSSYRKVTPELLAKEGLSTNVLDKLAPEFASFPSSKKGGKSFYGQPVKSAEDIRQAYNSSLGTIRKTQQPQRSTQPVTTALLTTLDKVDSGEMAHTTSGTRKPSLVSTSAVIPNRDSISVTSRRGMRDHPKHGGQKMHQGTDISAPSGTPLYAFTDGIITARGHDGGYGNYMAWKDSFGSEHFYAHMMQMSPNVGDTVKAGTVIGKTGGGVNDPGRGTSTGPHLHWEYGPEGQTGRGRNSSGLVDPLDKFDYMMPFGSKKILSKPDNSSKPTATTTTSFSPELGKLKQSADSISTPSGKRSAGGNITTINMPPTQTKTPVVTTSMDGGNKGEYASRPIVSAVNFDDIYQTHTRSLFNILK